MIEKENKKTSELLAEIIEGKKNEEKMSLLSINNFLHERGFGILLILFSFPMAIPLPYPPGFTTILGIPLLFYAVQMIIGKKDPWLPEWVSKKEIKVAHLRFAIEKSYKFFKFIERILKPRLMFMTSIKGERIIGVFTLLCAISIALPIWFGNAIPSLGIFIMSLGLLYKDGLIVLLGMITSIIGLIIATTVVILGVAFVQAIFMKSGTIIQIMLIKCGAIVESIKEIFIK